MLRPLPSASFTKWTSTPFGIACIYVLGGTIWILLSDSILLWSSPNPQTFNNVQHAKGIFFILSTGCWLFFLIKRRLSALGASEAFLLRQQEALREAEKKADHLHAARTTLLSNMSHELRTPLASIIGFADILEEEGEPKHRDFARVIGEAGQRLLTTLNEVLDLAQLESGDLPVRKQPVDLIPEIEKVVEAYRSQAEDRGLTLGLDVLPASRISANLDRTIFNHILSNLISNAIKFTHSGGITIIVNQSSTHVDIRVQDSGVGISEVYIPYVFDEFNQESSGLTRQFEGSGLGLMVTRKLVEILEGEIQVESKKGEGSVFTVRFPLSE